MHHANDAAKDQKHLLAEVSGIARAGLKSFYEVKTPADFKHWENQVGQYLPSNPVRLKPPTTVDSLFE
jgi:hypothetical protein